MLSTHITLLHYSVSQHYMVEAVVHLSVVYSHNSPPLQRVTAFHGGSGGASYSHTSPPLQRVTELHGGSGGATFLVSASKVY